MSLKSNIVHVYFKKESTGSKTFLKVDPIHQTGVELVIFPDNTSEVNEVELDGEIPGDLLAEGFTATSPLEFNLRMAGLANDR